MKYLTPVCLLALLGGCGIAHAPAPSPSPQTSGSLREAERLLAGDAQTLPDPDAALLITDRILEQTPDLRRARVLAAEANALLSQSRSGLKDSLLTDAARHYEQALAIDSNDYNSWMQLSWVYLQLARFKEGRAAAHEAIKLSNVKGKEKECGEAMLAKANCALRTLIQTIQDNPKEDGDDYSAKVIGIAQSVLLDYRAAKQFRPGESFLQSSYVYAYMQRRSDELNELEQGILRAPDHFPLHTRFRQLRAARGEQAQAVAFYRATLRDDGPNASVSFALGQAQTALADQCRESGDRQGAQRNYLAALAAFKTAKDTGPTDWKDSCEQWMAIENLSLARISQSAGNLSAAQEYLKAAYRNTPKVLDKDADGLPVIRDSKGSYYEGTLNNIGTSLAAPRTQDALRDSLDCWVQFTELHPNKLGWLYNNAAFTARDLGAGIEADGRRGDPSAREKTAKEAMALYEKSYALYQVAVRLSPDNARIVNDCGLMLIYHLHREYDHARKLFDRSIEIGRQAIEELPEDTPLDERHDAEEAVGDAYQNIGKMERDQGKPFDTYKGYLEQAVKYFPYQRRESALWLRTKGVGRRDRAAAQGKTKKVDPRIAAYAKVHAEAKKLADAKDYDGALLILDKVASTMVGVAAFHHDRGLYSFYYAKKAVASGGSVGLIDGLFGDARSNLQKSVELDGERIEPRLHLAQTNYESGEFVNAAKISEALLSHVASRGGTSDELLSETHKVRALAGNQVYVDAKMKRGDNPAELQAARNSFRSLEKMNKLDLDLRKKWSVLERWAGNNSAAFGIFSRALANSPNDQTVLGAYVEAARAVKQSTEAARVLATRKDALGLWYLGMSSYYSSFESANTDANAKLAESVSRLADAIKSFEASAAANATYKDSCRQWIAMCQGTQGFMTLDSQGQSDPKAALAFFEAAATTAPDRATAKILGNRTVKFGLQKVVDHYYRIKRDFPSAIAILKTSCAALPNDADLSNNLGLFARDYGAQLEQRGKTAEAKELFETSHDAYRNALRLEPGSLRQRNDLIVILLYHVKRDVDYAKTTLLDCIEESPAAIENFEGTEQEQRDLQETVGDCYENLGYYYWKFGKDPVKARTNLEKSLTFWPFKRRRGVAFLRQLEAEQSDKKK